MTKIILTGASGLLGRAIAPVLSPDYRLVRLGLRRAGKGIKRLDLLDASQVSAFIQVEKPDIIIHSAAERRPDVSQKDPAGTLALNVGVTRHLAQLSCQTGAWMIYLSTNYVFDGKNPPYHPADKTNPLNLYGHSKLEGEIAVWAETDQACVLRVPTLYGKVEFLGETSVTQIAEQIQPPDSVSIDHWAIRCPTWVDDVAVVCRQLIDYHLSNPNFSGTFHWSADEPMTKYEIAQIMAEALDYPTSHLVPSTDPPAGAPRPRNCQLDCSDLERLGFGKRTPFRQAIQTSLGIRSSQELTTNPNN